MRLLLVGVVALVTACGRHADGQTQAADFGFLFECEQSPASLSSRTAQFLETRGFKTLDLAKIQRTRNINIYSLRITALDSDGRIVEFISLSGNYTAELYSPPPTHHDAVFEGELQAFVSEQLRCRVSQVHRGTNAASVREFHEENVQRVKGLFKEAKELGFNGA